MRDEGPDWRDLALCRGMDVNLFFPVERPSPEYLAELPCHRCAAQAECLSHGERFNSEGVWGGVFRSQRMIIASRRRRHVDKSGVELSPDELRALVREHDQALEAEIKQGRSKC